MRRFRRLYLKQWVSRMEECSSLGQMLEESASLDPRRTAIFHDEGSISYRELNTESNRYAHAFRTSLGVTSSDRIAILLNNCEEFIYASFGALKTGASIVPLNTFLTAPELKYILEDSGAKVLITSDEFAPVVRSFSGELQTLKIIVTVGREDLGGDTRVHEAMLRGMPGTGLECAVGREELAVIIYTSGTTGKPKGAMLTHGNLLSNIVSSGRSIKITRKDRLFLVLPMFHSFTLTVCVMMPVAAGGSIIMVQKMRSPALIFKTLLMRRATIFIGIPHLYDVMAHRGIPFWLKPFIRLRLCVSGSAPLSATTLDKFEKRCGIPLLEGYGLSETSPVVSINPLDGVRKAGSVGKPIPGVSVRIVSGEGQELLPGQVGEIAVRGPNVMQGYLKRPRETKETIRGGWLLTGDIGKLDEEGYIYILDRKKDMILFHGMNVYPREIEEILYTHPCIAEASVVGKRDARRGEVPVAVVSLKDGMCVDPAELIRFCKKYLASYKVPHKILILAKLPRTATGKILKRKLRLNIDTLTADMNSDIYRDRLERKDNGISGLREEKGTARSC